MPEYLTDHQPSTEQLNEWIDYFHTNGFLVIKNVLTPEQCELLRNNLDESLKKTEGKNYDLLNKKLFFKAKQCLNLEIK